MQYRIGSQPKIQPLSTKPAQVIRSSYLTERNFNLHFFWGGGQTPDISATLRRKAGYSELQTASDRQSKCLSDLNQRAEQVLPAESVPPGKLISIMRDKTNKLPLINMFQPAKQMLLNTRLKGYTEKQTCCRRLLLLLLGFWVFFFLCMLTRIFLPVVVAFHNFPPCKSCSCDEWVKLCHSRDSLHCFLFRGIYGGASMLLFFPQYTEGTTGKAEVFKPTPLPATPLIFSKRTLPLLGVWIPPPPPHPHFQSTRCL